MYVFFLQVAEGINPFEVVHEGHGLGYNNNGMLHQEHVK